MGISPTFTQWEGVAAHHPTDLQPWLSSSSSGSSPLSHSLAPCPSQKTHPKTTATPPPLSQPSARNVTEVAAAAVAHAASATTAATTTTVATSATTTTTSTAVTIVTIIITTIASTTTTTTTATPTANTTASTTDVTAHAEVPEELEPPELPELDTERNKLLTVMLQWSGFAALVWNFQCNDFFGVVLWGLRAGVLL